MIQHQEKERPNNNYITTRRMMMLYPVTAKPKGMPRMGDSNPRNEKGSGQEYLEGKTSGKYCSTHRMKRGLLPRVGCYEPGGHLAPILGQHYDNEEVRLARTLQQHYDKLKEEKEAAERALKAHLAAAQNEDPCDRCGTHRPYAK